MNVSSILKVKGKSVATAGPEDTLEAIAKRLAERRIGAIVIVEEGGQVAGIISERDIIRALSQNGSGALVLPVGEVMTKDVMISAKAR